MLTRVFVRRVENKIETGKPVQTTPAQTAPEYVPPVKTTPPPTPVVGYAAQTTSPSYKNKLWLTLSIVALVVLVAVSALLGFSYASASGKLKTTKDTLATT